MTNHQALLHLRADTSYSELIRDSYIGPDLLDNARRFEASAEFDEVVSLLDGSVRGCRILDLGAGNGIASWAFAKRGAETVYAVEPNPSHEFGRGAICRLCIDLPVKVLDSAGETLPLESESIDIVYARQVLHHLHDLWAAMRECMRVLKRGGKLIACREHVVDDDRQLAAFLEAHPVHRLAGGENAFKLWEYMEAMKAAGLSIRKTLGPFDSVMNAFPKVRSTEELKRLPENHLEQRYGRLGKLASLIPGVKALVWRKLKRPKPGRMYSFLAEKS